ncbi:MAG: hypothetical protein AB7F86_01235 [Bdellovibrionales bacterium]
MGYLFYVKYSPPFNTSMGAPLISEVEIEGMDWQPEVLKKHYFHYDVSATSGEWVALARYDVGIQRANFQIFLFDAKNKKIYTSKVFEAFPERLKILDAKKVRVEYVTGMENQETVISDWEELPNT